MNPEQDIEARLREFRPRRPAAIPDERLQLLRGPMWIAVAAGLAAVMLIATYVQRPRPAPDADSIASLTRLALEQPAEFDAAMARISAASLPDVTRPGSALEPLSRGF